MNLIFHIFLLFRIRSTKYSIILICGFILTVIIFLFSATPYYCPEELVETVVDTETKEHSNKVNNKQVVRLTKDTFVEKVRFEGGKDDSPVGVLRPKEKDVSDVKVFVY